jgi:DNA polymerase-3 subunit alpha
VADLAEAQPAAESADGWVPADASRWKPTPRSADSSPPAVKLKTRKGDRMAVFTLEDAVGGVEIVVFPRAYQRAAALIETGTLVLVRGKLERDDEAVRILLTEIAPLDSVREHLRARVSIHFRTPADRGCSKRSARSSRATAAIGRCRSRSRRRAAQPAARPGGRQLADPVGPSPALISEVEQLVGAGRWSCDEHDENV